MLGTVVDYSGLTIKPYFNYEPRIISSATITYAGGVVTKPMKSVYQVIVVDENDVILIDQKVIAKTDEGAKQKAGAYYHDPDEVTIIVNNLGQVKEKKESVKN